MKKNFLIISLILIIGCIIVFNYNKIFSITDNKKQLEDSIIQSINRPTIVTDNIDIKQTIDIDNKKFVLFISNNFSGIGDAVLSKGINTKYEMDYTEYGSNIFQYRMQKTNRNKYFVIFGKNSYDKKIDYIKVILDGKEYKIKIPQQEYFISYSPVPNDTQSIFPDGVPKLYDRNDGDITNEIYGVSPTLPTEPR